MSTLLTSEPVASERSIPRVAAQESTGVWHPTKTEFSATSLWLDLASTASAIPVDVTGMRGSGRDDVGDDGLTDAERHEEAERYAATGGRAIDSELFARIKANAETRVVRRRSHVV